MRKLLIMAALVVSFASFASAQDTDSRGEFFAGYSLLRTDVAEDFDEDFDDDFGNEFKNLNGFNVAATGYFTPRVGITGDFSAHFKSRTEPGIGIPENPLPGNFTFEARTFNFLGGPQVRFTNSTRVTPFVRALAGVQSNRISVEQEGASGDDFSETFTDFALGIGGGVDVRVSPRVAIRAFQIDYNPVFVGDRQNFFGTGDPLEGERVDNVRFSIGVVFK